MSRFHQSVVHDALIPILMSLYAWEPFFWEQTRIGTLVPLLAAPISNPWHNLLFQTWLSIASGLTLLVLMVRYVFDRRGWRRIAITSVAMFLFVAPHSTQYLLLSTQVTYGAALSLGFAALLVLRWKSRTENRWIFIALVLSILAHWLNGATALLLVPLVIALGVVGRVLEPKSRSTVRWSRKEVVTGSGILIVGFAIGQILAWVSPYPLWHLHVLDVGSWTESWLRISASTWQEVKGPWSMLFFANAMAGLALAIRERRRERPAEALHLALLLCLAALSYWILLGASEWVKLNGYHPRYALPAVLTLHSAGVIAAFAPLTRMRWRWAYSVGWVATSLLLVASIVWSYGLPSPARARQSVDERLGRLSDDVRSGGVTHVLGAYGTVWTTVYHSNLLRYEEGRPGVVWGIAHRAGPTAKYWRNVSRWRIGVESGDHQWPEIARLYGLPELEIVDQVGALLILTPVSTD